MTISSKWGYVYTADWEVAADPPEVKHHDVETFRRQLAETREQLGDWLALYQIHSATPDSGVLDNDAVLSAMVESGVPLGVSVSGTSQAETIDRAVSLGIFSGRAGDLEPARAGRRGRTRPLRPEGDRQGGAGQRPPRGARRRGARAPRWRKPWATVVLSGAASLDVLRSNLRARETPPPGDLPDLVEDSEAYWALRGQLEWN